MKKIIPKNQPKKNAPPIDVDGYLATLPKQTQLALENLRKAIKASAPKAEETISYQIPTYKYNGPLVHFVARENYCSLIVVSKSIIKTFRKELVPYDTSGTTIHFSPEYPLPATLVQKIVKARVKENLLRVKH